MQQKQNLLGIIAHVSDNIILKIAPRDPRHYDVTDVFAKDDAKKFGKYYHIYEGFSVV